MGALNGNRLLDYRDRIEAAITKLRLMSDAFHYPDDVVNIDNIPSIDEVIATLEGEKYE